MIKVWVRRDGGKITAYRVEGHAGWAQVGQDIVCAAVSALVIASENGLCEIADAVLESRSSVGRLEVELKLDLEEISRIKADAILETMINALHVIKAQHPSAIRIFE
jgi:uncharacterized protein YsxB (DUF464 family)